MLFNGTQCINAIDDAIDDADDCYDDGGSELITPLQFKRGISCCNYPFTGVTKGGGRRRAVAQLARGIKTVSPCVMTNDHGAVLQ